MMDLEELIYIFGIIPVDYPPNLRNWIDNMPEKPGEILAYEDYLYTMLQSVYKEDE